LLTAATFLNRASNPPRQSPASNTLTALIVSRQSRLSVQQHRPVHVERNKIVTQRLVSGGPLQAVVCFVVASECTYSLREREPPDSCDGSVQKGGQLPACVAASTSLCCFWGCHCSKCTSVQINLPTFKGCPPELHADIKNNQHLTRTMSTVLRNKSHSRHSVVTSVRMNSNALTK